MIDFLKLMTLGKWGHSKKKNSVENYKKGKNIFTLTRECDTISKAKAKNWRKLIKQGVDNAAYVVI